MTEQETARSPRTKHNPAAPHAQTHTRSGHHPGGRLSPQQKKVLNRKNPRLRPHVAPKPGTQGQHHAPGHQPAPRAKPKNWRKRIGRALRRYRGAVHDGIHHNLPENVLRTAADGARRIITGKSLTGEHKAALRHVTHQALHHAAHKALLAGAIAASAAGVGDFGLAPTIKEHWDGIYNHFAHTNFGGSGGGPFGGGTSGGGHHHHHAAVENVPAEGTALLADSPEQQAAIAAWLDSLTSYFEAYRG